MCGEGVCVATTMLRSVGSMLCGVDSMDNGMSSAWFLTHQN
jgi:hypothetical protein